MSLITVSSLSKSFGTDDIFSGVNFTVDKGADELKSIRVFLYIKPKRLPKPGHSTSARLFAFTKLKLKETKC